MTIAKRTPLYDEHVRAGARMVEFAGWQMPVQYTSIIDEHRRVRTSVAMFDVSHMGEVVLAGPRAEAFCLRVFTNDARNLAPGRAQYTLISNERGGIVDDVIVYRTAPDRFLVCVNASNRAKDVAWLHAHALDGCEIEDRSDDYGLIAVQGPHAAGVLARFAPATSSLVRFACAPMTVAGADAFVARTGYTGEDGFELFTPADRATGVWRALLDAGVAPAGLGARDTLRLEAALPLYGHELDDETSPYEVGLGWAVKLDGRDDLVGVEALRAAREGGGKRRLIGLEMVEGIAREGCAVVACGANIGKVTSGSYSPSLGKALALALVEGDVVSGMEVGVDVRRKIRPARVTGLPFYVSGAKRNPA